MCGHEKQRTNALVRRFTLYITSCRVSRHDDIASLIHFTSSFLWPQSYSKSYTEPSIFQLSFNIIPLAACIVKCYVSK